MKKLCLLPIIVFIFFIESNYGQTKTFTVTFGSSSTPIKNLPGVNAGPNNSAAGYKDINVNMVRVHDYYGPCDYWNYIINGVDTTNKNISTPFNPQSVASYSWTASDAKINSIVTNSFTPYFRLGISYPQSLPPTPTFPPLDDNHTSFTKFASICKHTAMHYTQGWGNGFNYVIPYWEVWNEPDLGNLFWNGTYASPNNYYLMYKAVADSIKSLGSAYLVGGPGLSYAGSYLHTKPYFDYFINYCDNNNVPLDFFSWHLYDCFNPYSIKNYADTVRSILNSRGFMTTESHITEINPELGNTTYENTAKGSAYAASILITAQESHIDKLFWYKGETFSGLCNSDAAGQPNLTWSGYGYKAFSILLKMAPYKITSIGNEVINFNNTIDTTNLMALAGRSLTGDTVVILVSNYNSNYTAIDLNINNLPWNATHNIQVIKHTIQNPSAQLTQTTLNVTGNSNMNVSITGANGPSVFLVQLIKNGGSGFGNLEVKKGLKIVPNPISSSSELTLEYPSQFEGSDISIYDISGKLVQQTKTTNNKINLSESIIQSKGIYQLKIVSKSGEILNAKFTVAY